MSPSTRQLTFLAAVALAAGACGSNTTTAAKPRADSFVLTEWSVTAPTNTIRAGHVEMTVSNQGHETHELVIVRADNASALQRSPTARSTRARSQKPTRSARSPDSGRASAPQSRST